MPSHKFVDAFFLLDSAVDDLFPVLPFGLRLFDATVVVVLGEVAPAATGVVDLGAACVALARVLTAVD